MSDNDHQTSQNNSFRQKLSINNRLIIKKQNCAVLHFLLPKRFPYLNKDIYHCGSVQRISSSHKNELQLAMKYEQCSADRGRGEEGLKLCFCAPNKN